LLAAGEREDAFLAEPAAEFIAPLVTQLPPVAPTLVRVGPYRLERELGRGGMGIVYLAERDDGQFRQRVALKLVRRGLEVDDRLVRRFREERRILASLEHPHIARLVDGGLTDDGLPWFAMEFVEGEPIDRYCDARQLAIEDRLALFATVCDVVQAAHQQRVVHRDLKPSNVLVTADGQPKLLDFGIAKLLERDGDGPTTVTGSGERLLTPEHASPEQIRGEPVTEAGDVYSLGVLLYELLTGRRPFRCTGRSAAEIGRMVLEDEPPRPSAAVARPAESGTRVPVDIATARATSLVRLQRRLRGDLDAIVLKAMRKEPESRYAAAAELADDVRRHLSARPVVARRGTGGYRVRRFARRHRLSLSMAALGMLIGGAALAVVASTMRRSADRSTSAGANAEDAALPTLAVLPFKNLGPTGEQYFADGLTDETTARLAGVSGLRVISRTSADQYRDTRKPLKQIGAELGAAYVLEGSVRWERGPDGRRQIRVTPQLVRVADDTHLWADRFDGDATRVLEIQTQVAERVASALDVRLRSAERQALTAGMTASAEAYDYYLQAEDYARRGWEPSVLRNAARLYERAVTADSGFALAWAKLGYVHARMYWFYYDPSPTRLALAKRAAEAALRLAPDLPDAHLALGYYWYWGFRDYERALQQFAAAQARRPNDSDVLLALALVQRRQGRWDDASVNFRKSFELDPRSQTKALSAADVAMSMRDYAAARQYLERAAAFAPDHAPVYAFLADYHVVSQGDIPRAKASLRDAIDRMTIGTFAAFFGPEDNFPSLLVATPEFASRIDALTLATFQGDSMGYYRLKLETQYYRGNARLTRAYADSARAMLEAKVRQRPGDHYWHAALGIAYAMLGRAEDAVREGKRAVELLPISRDHSTGPFLLTNLARIYVITGDADDAVALLEQLLSIPSWISVSALRLDPQWTPLHRHPRFEQLVGRAS